MSAHSQYAGEWDVLIVLDACRYDYFERMNWIEGRLSKLEVSSSLTITWLKTYWPAKYPYVYISANPICNSKVRIQGYLGSEHFREVVDVWEFGWDEELKTVPPRRVTEAARRYLDEKLIVHYMQPHFPSIGRIRIYPEAWKPDPEKPYVKGISSNWSYPRELVRRAYEENLGIVLEEVEKLISSIEPDRKIAVTSDHGELLGEDGLYGHPNIRHPILNTVPFLEVR